MEWIVSDVSNTLMVSGVRASSSRTPRRGRLKVVLHDAIGKMEPDGVIIGHHVRGAADGVAAFEKANGFNAEKYVIS
jgi:hypothetical protein